jgi:hypothetical protein
MFFCEAETERGKNYPPQAEQSEKQANDKKCHT